MSRHLDAQKCAVKFQQDLAFRMLECGRSDLLREALVFLGADKIDTLNEQVSTKRPHRKYRYLSPTCHADFLSKISSSTEEVGVF